jgi:hypothetical protein
MEQAACQCQCQVTLLLPVLDPGREQDPGQGLCLELGVEQEPVPVQGLVQGLGLELVEGNKHFEITSCQ